MVGQKGKVSKCAGKLGQIKQWCIKTKKQRNNHYTAIIISQYLKSNLMESLTASFFVKKVIVLYYMVKILIQTYLYKNS